MASLIPQSRSSARELEDEALSRLRLAWLIHRVETVVLSQRFVVRKEEGGNEMRIYGKRLAEGSTQIKVDATNFVFIIVI